jgi:hypothetical protein
MSLIRPKPNGKYSRSEQLLLDLLLKTDDKISTTELLKDYYKGRDKPIYARQALTGTLQCLRRKVDQNREPFVIKRTFQQGPHPIKFWVEEKAKRRKTKTK